MTETGGVAVEGLTERGRWDSNPRPIPTREYKGKGLSPSFPLSGTPSGAGDGPRTPPIPTRNRNANRNRLASRARSLGGAAT
jgi:hypothetical protein